MKKFSFLMALVCAASMTFAESVDFSQKNFENGQAIESYAGETFTVTFDKGTNNNAPKYYNTGTAIRCYGGNTFTITGNNNAMVTAVTITFASGEGSNEISANVGTYSNGAWSGSANAVTFTIGGTSGHRRIQAFDVTVTGVSGPVNPVATFGNAVLRMGNTLDLATLFTSNSTGAVSYSIVEGSELATLNGSVLTPVAVGSVVVKASQAAVADEYNAIEKTATITIKAAVVAGPATTYTSNIALDANADLKASEAVVKIDDVDYPAIKCGTGSVAGAMKLTVPAGSTKLHVHLAAWNGETVTVGITGATVSPASLDLVADANIKGSANNYTLVNEPSEDYYFELTLSDIAEATELTFSATAGLRFVIFGVNVEPAPMNALESVEAQQNVRKVVENGQIFIEKNGVRYNVAGQAVR